ncbi:MAG TPA: long-chain fatty acid--CoA ligase [Pyrinomonadaceae bacterium]|nr:long-chain fatty acid--CoA ligase [Pyrinomonadaceae bacterium]HMP64685.1 long-chain fatty acid--CoA ligase [Pyrinomonadaceae bacterium]
MVDFVSPRKEFGRGKTLFPNEPKTLPELFEAAVRDHNRPDALSYKDGETWHAISSDKLLSRMKAVAAGLIGSGLEKGDRAAILSSNSPLWTIADGGCQFAGLIDVPIYTTLSPQSVQYILNDSASRVLFIENLDAFERIADILAECPALELVVFLNASSDTDKGISLGELEAKGSKLLQREPNLESTLGRAAGSDEIATLIYTSGTTGEPKGVMLTHNNIISNVIDAGERYSFSAADSCLSVLPLSHIFERSAMYLYIYNGMAVNYAESVDKTPDNLSEVMPTILVGVPRIFEKVYAKAKLKAAQSGGLKEKIFDWAIEVAKSVAMLKEEGRSVPVTLAIKHSLADMLIFSKMRKFFGGRLRFCITGGAALSDEIYLIFTGAGIPIMQGYGLTETSPVVSSNNPLDIRLGTVGKPIRNMSVRIASDGEIEVSGPGVMLGYYNKPQATADVFTDDGWFRTGDIGEVDAEGFLRITDRKKELFKTSGGKYIAPSPIEQMIKSSRFVSQVVLVGNERKFASALIVPNFDMLESYASHKGFETMSPAAFCRDRRIIDLFERQVAVATEGLAKFETVKKIALLENEFTVENGELTPTLKVKRRVIDERYRDVIDELYREE